MDCILGIDGGGTSTVCLLADGGGQTLAQAEAPASNHRKSDLREACAAIAAGVAAVLDMGAAISHTTPRIVAACAGLAGVDTPDDAAQLQQALSAFIPTTQLLVVNDGEIAIHGALEDEPGVLVISGTGSIVWATAADGRRLRVGGWDYVLSDEGSGYSIGLRVLRAVAAAHDRRTPPTALTDAVLCAFRVSGFDQLLDVTYDGLLTPQRIAALAPLADTHAAAGDAVAARLIDEAAKDLAQLSADAARLAGLLDNDVPFVLTGGVLLADGRFAERFRSLLNEALPRAHFVQPHHSPAEGAVLLALRDFVRAEPSPHANAGVR